MTERSERDNDLQTSLGMLCATLFAPRIDDEEIDVVEIPEESAVEIQADDWTLHLQGDPLTLAFVAIEDEPEGADALAHALRIALTPDELEGLGTLNERLDGVLAARLRSSGDALSATLAAILTSSTTS